MVLGSKQLLGRGLSASLFQGLRQGLVPFLSQPTVCSSLNLCAICCRTQTLAAGMRACLRLLGRRHVWRETHSRVSRHSRVGAAEDVC
jgi:hypothetical protein